MPVSQRRERERAITREPHMDAREGEGGGTSDDTELTHELTRRGEVG